MGPVDVRVQDGVAIITVDNPPVNAMSDHVRPLLIAAFERLGVDPAVRGIVLTGAGQNFVAGADIKEMALPSQPPGLPSVILAMEACPQPIVAAINGPALGGGFELTLACDLRLARPKAVVGLPETRIGLVPGSGGTQRLPRMIGVAKAIELIGSAKIMKADEALALGLVDRIVDDAVGEAVAVAVGTPKRRISELAVPVAPSAAVEAAVAQIGRRARGNPAILAAAALVRQAAELPIAEGLARERAEFLRLRETDESKALRHLFLAEREAQKADFTAATPRAIGSVAVIGGGTMGSGIATALADAELPVVLVERDAEAAAITGERIDGIFAAQVRAGRIDAATAERRRAHIAVSSDWNGVSTVDLVIEAVFEDMAVKVEVFRRLDGLARAGAILATNTSYLDVNEIAAATSRPQDVIGLHFFSPANVMRLLEVVRAARTAPDVLATTFRLARRIGKLPVLAGVCDGFIGNRIFTLYRREAEYLLEDGASPPEIDRAVEAYGFAMGPFAVADLAGLDISWAARKRRAPTRPPGERYVAVADRLCEAGRFGRKTGRGWYLYPEGTTKPLPDPDVATLIVAERAKKGIVPRPVAAGEIMPRLLAVMANEGAKILAEGIALRASDIDLVFTNGYGFPAVRGGPMFAADLRGLAQVVGDVETTGAEAAPLLRDLAARGATFAQWDEERK